MDVAYRIGGIHRVRNAFRAARQGRCLVGTLLADALDASDDDRLLFGVLAPNSEIREQLNRFAARHGCRMADR